MFLTFFKWKKLEIIRTWVYIPLVKNIFISFQEKELGLFILKFYFFSLFLSRQAGGHEPSRGGFMKKLIALYTEENLGKITARVIRAYRSGDRMGLYRIARGAGLNPEEYQGGTGRLFKRLMVTFHPDRIAHFHSMIRHYGTEGDEKALERMRENIHLAFREQAPQRPDSQRDYADAEYGPDRERINPEEDRWDDYLDGLSVREESSDEWGFLEAVRAMMYGNLFAEFLPKDLIYLEGILDLPWNDIEDLTGIEYCRNLTGLNLEGNRLSRLDGLDELPWLTVLYLGHNRLDDLSPLGRLTGLKSLDISFNDVEDVSPLLKLPGLEYVNLLGNPVQTTRELSLLRERCLVIYEKTDGGPEPARLPRRKGL